MSRSRAYVTAARLARLETRLSDQDRRVIAMVATVHLASGDQLQRVCFTDAATSAPASRARQTRRCLAYLVELGALSRLARTVGGVRAGSSGFVYALGSGGQRLVAGWNGDDVARRGRPVHEPGTRFAEHRLAVSQVYTGLAETVLAGQLTLGFAAEPECWRRFSGGWGAAQWLKPDAFARIQRASEELLWFIELDRGTVSAATLQRQITAYLDYWRSGHPSDGVMPRVLWLVPDASRAARVETLITASQAPIGLFVVALTADVTERLIGGGPS